MSLFIFLMVVQALIGAAMVGVILIQKSEGGGLGVGGSPSGFMSARGAADFLTRSTAVLATLFVVLSVVLAALAVKNGSAQTVDTSLNRTLPVTIPGAPGPVVQPSQSAPQAPVLPLDPLAPAAKK